MAKSRGKPPAGFLPAAGPESPAGAPGEFDVVLVTGDAYVDHPSFGAALIGRFLESLGYRVAILAQPPWGGPEAFRAFGRPRLFFGVTSGAVDAALNRHYSLGALRGRDAYSPGGRPDRRPPNPLVVYTALARQAFPGVPVVLGGLEASLKRLVHVDFVSETLKRPVLADSKADLLVFGMGEAPVAEVARRLAAGDPVESLTDVPGTSFRVRGSARAPEGAVPLPGFEEQHRDRSAVLRAHVAYEEEGLRARKAIVQECDPGAVVVLPPAEPLAPEALDRLFALPFRREVHPMYGAEPPPALEPVRFSVVTHRGCFGGCSFCSLSAHQGKRVVSRTADSVLAEIESFRAHPAFRGSVPDVGGPTANMYGVLCRRDAPCARPSCLFPSPCRNLSGEGPMMELLERIASVPGVKARVASGVRHDLALGQGPYLRLLASRFTGGQLKVAPEHRAPEVLRRMRKPPFEALEEFESRFREASRKAGKEQYLVPYFISGHPGCTTPMAVDLTEYLANRGWKV
ncbi:MAG: YgiQ family radical SAM protein, partial [Planctomycetes bacterium]|nr:YgiQ family radical SAM protein [Planctomycetota bacterium]